MHTQHAAHTHQATYMRPHLYMCVTHPAHVYTRYMHTYWATYTCAYLYIRVTHPYLHIGTTPHTDMHTHTRAHVQTHTRKHALQRADTRAHTHTPPKPPGWVPAPGVSLGGRGSQGPPAEAGV